MAAENNGFKNREKHCFSCYKMVQAERNRIRWNGAPVLLAIMTFGLSIPIWVIIRSIISPWRCPNCQQRIEPWYTSLGRATVHSFCGVVAAAVVIPATISFIPAFSSENASSFTGQSAQSKLAIEKEKARRLEKNAEFEASRDKIVNEIRVLSSAGQYERAATLAEPYLFTKDTELVELHTTVRNTANEIKLVALVNKLPPEQLKENANAYGQLVRLNPANEHYQEKHAYYTAKVATWEKKIAAENAARATARAKKARQVAAAKAEEANKRAAAKEKTKLAKAKKELCEEQATLAYIMSQDFVKRKLKSPSTADFPSMAWNPEDVSVLPTGNCDYTISSYVDSQNTFGAMIRTRYIATVRPDADGERWSASQLRFFQ